MRVNSITSLVKLILISGVIFSSPVLAEENRVELSQGTLFISGSLAFNYRVNSFSKGQHKFALNSDVGAGYFVRERIAVGASLPSKWTFVPANKGQFGLSLFSMYFFEWGSIVVPYVGVKVTPSYSLSELAFKLSAGISGGTLISLSDSVALDFGLYPEIYFPLNKSQEWQLEIPAGFVGIRAFF